MFNFTTTTIINANVDPSTGSALILTNSEEPKLGTNEILIKRVGKFDKKDVLSVTKAAYEPAVLEVTKVTVGAAVAGDIYRLALYVKLSGSQNSYYANDFVYKGKPFFIEAIAPNVDSENIAASLATAIVKNSKKYLSMVYEKELLQLSNDSGGSAIITIKATDPHQVITKAELQHWVVDEKHPNGEWIVEAEQPEGKVTKGKPGFGTYEYLLHNYVLPTGANLRYGHILENEAPMVGGHYNQYIIRMCKNRGVMGGDAVGEHVKSITTHVFWVNSAVASLDSTFNTAMGKIGSVTVVNNTKVNKGQVLPEVKSLDPIE